MLVRQVRSISPKDSTVSALVSPTLPPDRSSYFEVLVESGGAPQECRVRIGVILWTDQTQSKVRLALSYRRVFFSSLSLCLAGGPLCCRCPLQASTLLLSTLSTQHSNAIAHRAWSSRRRSDAPW